MEMTTPAKAPARLTIDVWADVLCPWCYLGERRLSSAIARSPHAAEIEVKVHTFELDPAAPSHVGPTVDHLAAKYGVTAAQARSMEQKMAGLAAAEGLPYEVDRLARNTFDQLRLVHLGALYGVAWEYLRAMQAEVFGGNPEAFEHDTLVRIGEELGIPAEAVREVLATDRFADAVRADHDAVVALGASGVPFTVLGNRLGIPGAVGVDQYAAAIDKAMGADQAREQANG